MSNVITLVENQNNFTLTAAVEGNDGLVITATWKGKSLGTSSFSYTGDGQVGEELSSHDRVFLIANSTQEIAEMFPMRIMFGEIEQPSDEELDEIRADLDAFADFINNMIDEESTKDAE